jgi:hypothetical protein
MERKKTAVASNGGRSSYAFFDSGHQAYTIITIMASKAIGKNKKLFIEFIFV